MEMPYKSIYFAYKSEENESGQHALKVENVE